MYKIPANTLFIGQTGKEVPECHSTNTALAEEAGRQLLPEGFVYLTSHQTSGRGQRGSVWITPAGEALTFSILLRPAFLPVSDQFELVKVVSVAAREAVAAYVPAPVVLKWPNDLLAGSEKLGGILIENQVQGSVLSQSIIGIGLNINQADFPSGLRATSLFRLGGQKREVSSVFATLLERLESRYLQLRQGHREAIRAAYFDHLLGYRVPNRFRTGNRIFDGQITGVDSFGRLQVQEGDTLHIFTIKEVEYPV